MFETKDGVAEWQKLYQFIPKDVGATVTFKQLDQALGRDFRTARGPLYRAMTEMETNDHRTLCALPGMGYRVVKPEEHERLGRLHHRKGVRSLTRSKRKFASADRALLSPEAAARMDQMQARIGVLEDHVRHLNIRADRQEAAHQSVATKVEATSTELSAKIAKIQETLKKHGMAD